MTRKEINDRLIETIRQQGAPNDITDSMCPYDVVSEELGFDSMDMAMLYNSIEKDFGITLPDKAYENMMKETLTGVVSHIKEELKDGAIV